MLASFVVHHQDGLMPAVCWQSGWKLEVVCSISGMTQAHTETTESCLYSCSALSMEVEVSSDKRLEQSAVSACKSLTGKMHL